MFSSSVAGGSICLRCQLRAVTRRAIPSVAAAQIRGRKRQYASEATKTDPHEEELEAILKNQRHDESRQRQNGSNWAQKEQQELYNTSKHGPVHSHRDGGSCAAELKVDEPGASEEHKETEGAPPEVSIAHDGHAGSVEKQTTATLDSGSHGPETIVNEDGTKRSPYIRKTYIGTGYDGEAPKKVIRKNYRRGSMTLEADSSKLNVNTLGKPAEVIVLRDRGTWKKKALPVFENSEEADQGSLAIEEFLDQEDGLSPDSFIRYIHGLKPEHNIVSTREFKSVFDTLLGGFTSLQLEYYVEWYRQGKYLEENEDQTPDEHVISEDDVILEDELTLEDAMTIENTIASEDITASEQPSEIEDVVASEYPAETEDVEADENQTTSSSLFDKPEVYPWLVEQAHWSPEVPGSVEETEYPLRGYILKSMRPKPRLAMQLMRECWGVSAQELQDGNGRLDVRVRDLEFKLLTLGNQRWLHKIARIFLKEGKQMEAIRSQNLIRIVAPKVVAETCVKALDETLQKKKTKSFKLDQVPMQNLDAGILAELGRMTNSVVEFSSSHDEIRVTWIDIRDEASQTKLEDLGDVIFRLLLTAHTSANTTNTLTIYPELEDEGKFIEDLGDKSKLSWIDRRRQWARLCLPLTSGKTSSATTWPLTTDALKYEVQLSAEDLNPPSSTLKPKIGAYYKDFVFNRPIEGEPLAIPRVSEKEPEEQESKAVQGPEPTTSGWQPFKVSTNAVFGHMLHEYSPSLIHALGQPTTALAKWPRTLSPLIPPIASMNLPGWVPYKQPIDATSTILMRFVPYAEDDANTNTNTNTTTKAKAKSPPPPQLELRLLASDTHVISIHSLRAISQTCISDILLPAEYVDVRSTQRLYAELPGHVIDTTDGMSPLADFLRDSRLSPRKGELVTPPRVRDLGLPGWLLRGVSSPSPSPSDEDNNNNSSINKKNNKDDALVPTSYVFAGLEVHRTMETAYDGWRLVYTSVEAGQGGGRRAELSLEAVPAYDRSLRRDAKDMDAAVFLQSMYQLARGLEGRVVKGHDGEDLSTSIAWVNPDRDGGGVE